jgi:hypothetical protein
MWRAAHLLMNHWDEDSLWFVFDANEVVGTLTYHDLFKPSFRVCLFALTVELEQASLRLAMKDAAASWAVLTPNRQQRAEENLRRSNLKRLSTPADLLEFTTFIDKKTILTKRRLIPGVPLDEVRTIFDEVEELRNRCAHPDSADEPFIDQPKELLRQVLDCHRLLWKINNVIEPSGPSPEGGT